MKFTECVEVVGSSCKRFEGFKKYISTGAIDEDHINESDVEIVTFVEKPSRANLVVSEGDIIFAKMQSTKKVMLIDSELSDNIYSTGFCAVKAKQGIITNKCLLHLLSSEAFLSQKDKNCSGATQKSITNAGLEKVIINIPEYENQNQIAVKLDHILRVIKLRKEELYNLDQLIKARFVEMFGDPVANNKEWEVKKLKDISVQINSGNTPKGGSENYVNEGIIFFRSQNVWKNHLEMEDIAYIDEVTHKKMYRSSLKYGDILMTKTGRINTENSSLGRAALYLGEDDKANVNGHVYFIRLKSEVNNKFVLRILTSPEYRDLIRSVCVGGIDKRQLNKEHIENFPIIYPPFYMVNEYVLFADQVDKSKFVPRPN